MVICISLLGNNEKQATSLLERAIQTGCNTSRKFAACIATTYYNAYHGRNDPEKET